MCVHSTLMAYQDDFACAEHNVYANLNTNKRITVVKLNKKVEKICFDALFQI